jgi:hypothetical protein
MRSLVARSADVKQARLQLAAPQHPAKRLRGGRMTIRRAARLCRFVGGGLAWWREGRSTSCHAETVRHSFAPATDRHALRPPETARHPLQEPGDFRQWVPVLASAVARRPGSPRRPSNSETTWRKTERRVRDVTADPAGDAPRTGCRTRDIRPARRSFCAGRAV